MDTIVTKLLKSKSKEEMKNILEEMSYFQTNRLMNKYNIDDDELEEKLNIFTSQLENVRVGKLSVGKPNREELRKLRKYRNK